MELIQFIITIVTSLTVGGIITNLLTIRYQKNKVKSEADQSAQTVIDMQIKSAQELIQMYKDGMDSIKALSDQREVQLKTKLSELEVNIKEVKTENEKLKELTEVQAKQLDQLRHTQNQLKLQLESFKSQQNTQCEICEFKSGCNKYIAKKEKNQKAI